MQPIACNEVVLNLVERCNDVLYDQIFSFSWFYQIFPIFREPSTKTSNVFLFLSQGAWCIDLIALMRIERKNCWLTIIADSLYMQCNAWQRFRRTTDGCMNRKKELRSNVNGWKKMEKNRARLPQGGQIISEVSGLLHMLPTGPRQHLGLCHKRDGLDATIPPCAGTDTDENPNRCTSLMAASSTNASNFASQHSACNEGREVSQCNLGWMQVTCLSDA